MNTNKLKIGNICMGEERIYKDAITKYANDPELAEDIEEEYYVLRESFKRKKEGQSNG